MWLLDVDHATHAVTGVSTIAAAGERQPESIISISELDHVESKHDLDAGEAQADDDPAPKQGIRSALSSDEDDVGEKDALLSEGKSEHGTASEGVLCFF